MSRDHRKPLTTRALSSLRKQGRHSICGADCELYIRILATQFIRGLPFVSTLRMQSFSEGIKPGDDS